MVMDAKCADNLAELSVKARQAVMEAGEILKEHWFKPSEVRRKGRIDLVTATDLALEQFLIAKLSAIAPEATIMAEETARDVKPGRLTWIIDPLDGTTNFAHRLPFAAISVGLWHDDHPLLGIVNAPMLGECYWAVKDQGAFVNDRPLRVSETADLEDALVVTGFPYTVREHIKTLMLDFESVVLHTQGMRRLGAASIDLAYVAAGRFDAFYEMGLKPWDTAAGWLLVTEAGGQVSQYEAHKPYNLQAQTILATNGRLHQAVSRLLGA